MAINRLKKQESFYFPFHCRLKQENVINRFNANSLHS